MVEPKRRPSSLGFSRVWKGVGTQRLRPRGAFPTSPALSEGCRLPEHPGLKTQGRARPLFAPEGPGVLPASTPGLVGPPRPQALGRGGPGRREVPGGCPATPPLAGACPRRAWCRAAGPRAGRKHGGQVTLRPRVLEAQATRRTTFCAQGGPACAHAWPVSDRRPPAGPPLRPALSGAGSTGSVASARPGHRKCGGPAFPPRPPLAGSRRPPRVPQAPSERLGC